MCCWEQRLKLIITCRLPAPEKKSVSLTVDDVVEAVEEDDVSLEIEFDDLVSEDIGADGDDGFETAAAQAPEFDFASEDAVDLEMEIRDAGDLITDNDFIAATAETMASVPVKGSVGNSIKAASGAVDRMSQEILNSMQERETIVIWMFDQSASLMRQREELLNRFDRIYDELGILEAAGHKAFDDGSGDPRLMTQVYAFGSRIKPMMKKPPDSLAKIKTAVQEIERDSSGIENVMEAVIVAAKQHASYRKVKRTTGEPEKNVLIFVVSDEAGDDVARIDEAVQVCNKSQIPIYVIGVPAPFGRAETQVKWVDPDPEFDQTPQWAIVSQGPETIMPERLRLDSTGTFDDLEMVDSGFGPFHLTRLAYETGGIYFAVHPNRNTKRRVKQWETKSYAAYLRYFFDPDVMRRYKPDYVSNRTYHARLKENKSRDALVKAAMFTTTGKLESPRLRFEKTNEARFVDSINQAQQSAAIVEPAVNRLYDILKSGEEDRSNEISPRWQAGFDLAMGRSIAAKVRAESYNAMRALVKTGSQDTKLLNKAKSYLNRVIEEHPGTPWALMAQRELATPIGWKWKQAYTAPPQPRPQRQGNNNNNRPRPVPQPRENAMPKVKRPPPKL